MVEAEGQELSLPELVVVEVAVVVVEKLAAAAAVEVEVGVGLLTLEEAVVEPMMMLSPLPRERSHLIEKRKLDMGIILLE